MSARRLVAALIALAALVAPASAGAFNNTDIDVDGIPRLPCGDRPLPNDAIWCGKWETDQPIGPLATFEPLGVITLDLISQPNAQAVEGKPFGAFNYTSKCTSPDAHNFAGTYRGSGSTTGDAGRILACSQGTTLYGTYRSQELENAGNTFPGSGLRSGEFTITHNLGGAAAAFTGTILQHFSATVPWTGRCVSATCQGELPAQPPIVGPALFRIVGFGGKAEYRSAADGVTRRAETGWLVGAGDRISAQGSLRIGGKGFITLQAIPSGAVFEIEGAVVQDARGNNIPAPAVFVAAAVPTLRQGEATITTTGPRTQARSTALEGTELLTPVSRVSLSGGVARVTHDPRRRLTTVSNVRGSASVTPTNRALKGLQLAPGHGVEITQGLDHPALRPRARWLGRAGPAQRHPQPPHPAGGAGDRHGALPPLAAVPARLEVRARRGDERPRRPRAGDDLQRPAQRAPVRPAPRGLRRPRPQDPLHPGARPGTHVRRADAPELRRRLRPRGPGPFRGARHTARDPADHARAVSLGAGDRPDAAPLASRRRPSVTARARGPGPASRR